MVTTLQAEKLTLYDLENRFKLKFTNNEAFFPECRGDLPELKELDKAVLNRIKNNYLNLAKRGMLENMVKMVVLSPLLDLAGFYLPPFYTTSEKSVEIVEEDEEVLIRGKIDILVLQSQLWVLVIESKKAGFSLEVGIPQALAYMLAGVRENQPLFGFVTNGSNFIFLKLVKQDVPVYALSDEFSLRRGNDLYSVLGILQKLSEVVVE
ncbi:MAG: type I restriction endonuclease [Spirulinaceae cyanobacterium]